MPCHSGRRIDNERKTLLCGLSVAAQPCKDPSVVIIPASVTQIAVVCTHLIQRRKSVAIFEDSTSRVSRDVIHGSFKLIFIRSALKILFSMTDIECPRASLIKHPR